jgi:hypothetical protein
LSGAAIRVEHTGLGATTEGVLIGAVALGHGLNDDGKSCHVGGARAATLTDLGGGATFVADGDGISTVEGQSIASPMALRSRWDVDEDEDGVLVY